MEYRQGDMAYLSTSGIPFRDFALDNFYYVDKTMLIADVLGTNPQGVFLYTRPRRFGKTTNLSMMDAFLNMEYAGNDWFDGLAISEHHEFDSYRNAFPVINISLKDIDGSSYESFIDGLTWAVAAAYSKHENIVEREGAPMLAKIVLKAFYERNVSERILTDSLRSLTEALAKHYCRKTVILIDEYDYPVTESFDEGDLDRITRFLGRFMSSTLKDNPNLQLAYVTGITTIAKAGMFSSLNNVVVNDVYSDLSDERFGFTENEVKDLLEYYRHPEKIDEVREWYDGYRFGKAEVYNPYSVIGYVTNGFEPRNYWVATGSNRALRWAVDRCGANNVATITDLIQGIPTRSGILRTMTYDDLRSALGTGEGGVSMFSLMVVTGYLNAVPCGEDEYLISTPNAEVRESLRRIVRERSVANAELYRGFADALFSGDAEKIEESVEGILASGSYLTLREHRDYQNVLMTAICCFALDREVRLERESGNGRTDIMISPSKGRPGVIMEIKVSRDERSLGRDADDALAQIRERRYGMGMTDGTVLVGIAFHMKSAKAVTARLGDA